MGAWQQNQMPALEFGCEVYKKIVLASCNRNTLTYATHNRHLPCHNTLCTKVQFRNSVHALLRAWIEVATVDTAEFEADVQYYFCRVCAALMRICPFKDIDFWEDKKPSGIRGAGGLTVQHYVQWSTCLGRFPPQFLTQAHIGGGTEQGKYWKRQGLHADGDFTKLLEATAFLLGVSKLEAEELACRYKQHVTGTGGRYSDVVFPECPISFVDPLDGVLKRLHRDGSTSPVMPRPLHSLTEFGTCPGTCYWRSTVKGQEKLPAKRSRAGNRQRAPNLPDFFPITTQVATVTNAPSSKQAPSNASARNARLQCLQLIDPATVLRLKETMVKSSRVNPRGLAQELAFAHDETPKDPVKENVLFETQVLTINPVTKRIVSIRIRGGNSKEGFQCETLPQWRADIPPKRPNKKHKGHGRDITTATFYRVGIKKAGRDPQPAEFPDAGFPLRPDFRGQIPIDWDDHDFPYRLKEANCKASFTRGNERWFHTFKEATEFAVFHAVFECQAKYNFCASAMMLAEISENSAGARTPDVVAEALDPAPVRRNNKKGEGSAKENDCKEGSPLSLLAVRVLIWAGDKRNYAPCIVSIKYEEGGAAHYLVDRDGNRTSGIYLKLPAGVAKRRDLDGEAKAKQTTDKVAVDSIVSHDRLGTDKSNKTRLRVRWGDGAITMEPMKEFEKECFWLVLEYGRSRGLIDQPNTGFRHLRPKNKHFKDPGQVFGHDDIDLDRL